MNINQLLLEAYSSLLSCGRGTNDKSYFNPHEAQTAFIDTLEDIKTFTVHV